MTVSIFHARLNPYMPAWQLHRLSMGRERALSIAGNVYSEHHCRIFLPKSTGGLVFPEIQPATLNSGINLILPVDFGSCSW